MRTILILYGGCSSEYGVALPGHSEHQAGLTIGLGLRGLHPPRLPL